MSSTDAIVIPRGSGLPVDLRHLALLSGAQRAEVAAILDEIQRRGRMLTLRSMFPDSGPYRRELYPRHLEFYQAGAKYRERVFMAGNRCITPWTAIEMPGATRLVAEILGEQRFDVRSWDGGSRCARQASGVFLKGIEPAFRVRLDNGQEFDCSRRHRVLTVEGWLSLGQIVRASSGLHCWHASQGSTASCDADGHPRDAQPRAVQGSDQGLLPSAAGAQKHGPLDCVPMDAWARTPQHSRASQPLGRPSIDERPDLIAALCGLFEDPALLLAAQWPTGIRQELQQLVREFALRQSASASVPRPPYGEWFVDADSEGRGAAYTHSALEVEVQGVQLCLAWKPAGTEAQRFLRGEQRTETFVTWDGPALVGGARIVGVTQLDCQPILDFTVSETANYEIGGVVHHNTGKTMAAGCEWTYHLTGDYPSWWTGHRFSRPIRLMVSGDTHETTRDILQVKLLGATLEHKEDMGTGLIPGKAILSWTPRVGVPGAVEKVRVAYKGGGASELLFRSYVQGRKIFQGTELDGFWPDEECPQDVYEEGLIRLMTRRGLATLTFTPLEGLTELIQQLDVPPDELEKQNRYIVRCGWDDAPHLTPEMKREMYAKLPPHQRDARTNGVPRLGSGAIYPVLEEDIVVPDFVLPAHFKRGYGLDVGWNRTAASFLAFDQQSDVLYLYAEHYRGQAEPAVHSQAIQARGKWLRGAIDPAARGRSQIDGQQLLQQYQNHGLHLMLANNAVEAGIYEVWERMSTGRLKVFKSCVNHLAEYRVYRRDDKGQIVKKNDHAMDSMRYGVNTLSVLQYMPKANTDVEVLMRARSASTALDPAMGY